MRSSIRVCDMCTIRQRGSTKNSGKASSTFFCAVFSLNCASSNVSLLFPVRPHDHVLLWKQFACEADPKAALMQLNMVRASRLMSLALLVHGHLSKLQEAGGKARGKGKAGGEKRWLVQQKKFERGRSCSLSTPVRILGRREENLRRRRRTERTERSLHAPRTSWFSDTHGYSRILLRIAPDISLDSPVCDPMRPNIPWRRGWWRGRRQETSLRMRRMQFVEEQRSGGTPCRGNDT
eukprot:763778-Hanusia_phi.AAC.5